MATRYRQDPYWISAKYAGACKRCGDRIGKGYQAFYYPKTRDLYCQKPACGQQCAGEFAAAAQDEDFYNSQY